MVHTFMSMKKLFWLLAFLLCVFPAKAQFPDHTNYVVSSTGSANAQALAVPNYVGPVVRGLMSFGNTGAMTLNVNGTGVIAVKKQTGSGLAPLSGGEVVSGEVSQFLYDGTQYELLLGYGSIITANGINIVATEPNVLNNGTDLVALNVSCTENGSLISGLYGDEACTQITQVSQYGLYVYNSQQQAKTTFVGVNNSANWIASGEKIYSSVSITDFSMGDAFASSRYLNFSGAPQVEGDEGIGDHPNGNINQQSTLSLATITSVTKTSCNTTTTQAITTRSPTAQAVTVASTTGCNVDDWLVLEATQPSLLVNEESVQITAVGSGTISGVFQLAHQNGSTITPALVLGTAGFSGQIGEGRVIVDHSGTTYNTGTITAVTGGGVTGSGTNWTAGMVGGGATNIGCLWMDADTFTGAAGAPFSGTGTNGPLISAYEIYNLTSTTNLGLFTLQPAGSTAYSGYGPPPTGKGGAGNYTYTIQPCVRILRSIDNQIIAETTTTTWTVGDSIEMIIAPYSTVYIGNDTMSCWTAGCNLSSGTYFNNGVRTISVGTSYWEIMYKGSNSDYPVGWGTIVNTTAAVADNYFSGGSFINNAFQLQGAQYNTGLTDINGNVISRTDNSGKIIFGSAFIMPNTYQGGSTFDLAGTASNVGGALLAISGGSNSAVGGGPAQLRWYGEIGADPVTVATLPYCSANGSVTASMGASFTATGTGTSLAVTSVTGYISTGDTIQGTGVTLSGGPGTGGAGTYTTSAATTYSGASLTTISSVLNVSGVTSGTVTPGQTANATAQITASITGDVMNVTALQVGGQSLAPGLIVTGIAAIPLGTTILNQLTGSPGSTGTYTLTIPNHTNSVTVGSNTLTAAAYPMTIWSEITGTGGDGTYNTSSNSFPQFFGPMAVALLGTVGLHAEVSDSATTTIGAAVTGGNSNFVTVGCHRPATGWTVDSSWLEPGLEPANDNSALLRMVA